MTRLAIALGGNALIRRGEPGSIEVQRHNVALAARSLVDLAERSGAEIVITHGNGPQVGFLAIHPLSRPDRAMAEPLAQELQQRLRRRVGIHDEDGRHRWTVGPRGGNSGCPWYE